MIKIAHRGNMFGPTKQENQPGYVMTALEMGYDAEVDVWYMHNNIWSGHDSARYLLSDSFMSDPNVINHVWFHCKNLESLTYFLNSKKPYKFFWHQNDNYALTSNNIIWTYPEKPVLDKCIIVHFDKELPDEYRKIAGVCGDYVGYW